MNETRKGNENLKWYVDKNKIKGMERSKRRRY